MKQLNVSVTQQLHDLLDELHRELPPPDKSAVGTLLFRLFMWQELERYAAQMLKQAWLTAQSDGGICEVDDALRGSPLGEREICSSKTFCLMVELKKPATRLDMDSFMQALARKFRTDVGTVAAIADKCRVENKPSLTKRVVLRVRELVG